MQSSPNLLIVDDNRNLTRALVLALRDSYTVDVAANGAQALSKIENEQYGAIVLDLNLPGMPGLEVCRQFRERNISVPVLILSGEDQVLTKINLLDAGANDYLTKPFSLGELKARLRAVIRTAGKPERELLQRQLNVGCLLLDRQTHTVLRDGTAINLRRKEFALLECLMQHAGNVVTRPMLIKYAWHGGEDPWTNTIDVHIKYLRDKLDRPFSHPIIKTVHGLGYRLTPEPVASKKQ